MHRSTSTEYTTRTQTAKCVHSSRQFFSPRANSWANSAVNPPDAAPKHSRLRATAEAEWRAMLSGEDLSAPRAPRVPLASRLGERTGRKTALRSVARVK
jgi:hypothetical protein